MSPDSKEIANNKARTFVAGLEKTVEANAARLTEATEEHIRMWEAIEHLRYRPPVWATLVMMALSGIVGMLAGPLVR